MTVSNRLHIQLAYILAGGQSTRFGSPKALVSHHGVPLIESLCRDLEQDHLEPTIVSQCREDFAGLSRRCIIDLVPDSGPLAGVQAALTDCSHCNETWCWILTCDLLRWEPAWNTAIEASCNDSSLHDKWVVLLDATDHSANEFMPFPGVYSVAALASLRDAWNDGVRSVRAWHTAIESRIRRVVIPDETLPLTFNTPQELEQQLARFKDRG